MTTTEHSQQPRQLTPTELAVYIKRLREMRLWSQEQLAAIAGINVRTIQRVEQGLPASIDTRRALARAFDFEDIDLFNKTFTIPTEEEVKATKEKFDKNHVTLQAYPLTTGRQLAKLTETCSMDLCEPAFELTIDAAETFAMLVDFLRDYRDCAADYRETQKLEIYDEMQSHINTLQALGVSLCYATRKIQVKWGSDADVRPMPATVLYVVCFPVGQEPDHFATPKSATISL